MTLPMGWMSPFTTNGLADAIPFLGPGEWIMMDEGLSVSGEDNFDGRCGYGGYVIMFFMGIAHSGGYSSGLNLDHLSKLGLLVCRDAVARLCDRFGSLRRRAGSPCDSSRGCGG